MATSTVSSVTGDVWQLIASNTPTTSPTQIDFSSISGYKTIMVACKGITTGGAATIGIICNNNTTTGNYAGSNAGGTETVLTMNYGAGAGARGLMAVIYDVDKSTIHRATTSAMYTISNNQAYLDPTPITTLSIYAGGQTITGGTIYLYGIAA